MCFTISVVSIVRNMDGQWPIRADQIHISVQLVLAFTKWQLLNLFWRKGPRKFHFLSMKRRRTTLQKPSFSQVGGKVQVSSPASFVSRLLCHREIYILRSRRSSTAAADCLIVVQGFPVMRDRTQKRLIVGKYSQVQVAEFLFTESWLFLKFSEKYIWYYFIPLFCSSIILFKNL